MEKTKRKQSYEHPVSGAQENQLLGRSPSEEEAQPLPEALKNGRDLERNTLTCFFPILQSLEKATSLAKPNQYATPRTVTDAVHRSQPPGV